MSSTRIAYGCMNIVASLEKLHNQPWSYESRGARDANGALLTSFHHFYQIEIFRNFFVLVLVNSEKKGAGYLTSQPRKWGWKCSWKFNVQVPECLGPARSHYHCCRRPLNSFILSLVRVRSHRHGCILNGALPTQLSRLLF